MNGEPLPPGVERVLEDGSRLAFGHLSETWRFENAGPPPELSATNVITGSIVLAVDSFLALPSSENPLLAVFRDVSGDWVVESGDGTLQKAHDGAVVQAGNEAWRLQIATEQLSQITETDIQIVRSLRDATLVFNVSRDEELVKVTATLANGGVVELGERAHNYMLLVLARVRKKDEADGLRTENQGWMAKEELSDALRMTRQQLDVEVFRVRKLLSNAGFADAASIIERRPRTTGIRLGVANTEIKVV